MEYKMGKLNGFSKIHGELDLEKMDISELPEELEYTVSTPMFHQQQLNFNEKNWFS